MSRGYSTVKDINMGVALVDKHAAGALYHVPQQIKTSQSYIYQTYLYPPDKISHYSQACRMCHNAVKSRPLGQEPQNILLPEG
jgi:hypothetical protein